VPLPPPSPAGQPSAAAPPPPPEPAPPPPIPKPPDYARRPTELFLGIGYGNAVCDNDEPDSQCPVDGGVALTLGGGWRFAPYWSVGLELGLWDYAVREEWRGQIQGAPDEVSLSSWYFGPYVRWYWFDRKIADPYMQAGIGLGTIRGEASNETSEYRIEASGITFPLGIGVEWQVADIFRLGPQLLGYLHFSNEICEDPPPQPGDPECRDPVEDENGEREGRALPWRLIAMGTFTLGQP
jgi:hypothetical protein